MQSVGHRVCVVFGCTQPQEFRREPHVFARMCDEEFLFSKQVTHLTSNKPRCILHFRENRTPKKLTRSLTLEAPSEKIPNNELDSRSAFQDAAPPMASGCENQDAKARESAPRCSSTRRSIFRSLEKQTLGVTQGRRLSCMYVARAHFGGALPHHEAVRNIYKRIDYADCRVVPGNGQLVCAHTHYQITVRPPRLTQI
jgi:hypothetical protein